MAGKIFEDVDAYIDDLFVGEDAALEATLAASRDGGLPEIQISANQGKFLYLMAKLAGAKRILELGTLGGYSTIWLARTLPASGQVVTLEYDAHHAEVARANLDRAGVGAQVEIIVGDAHETLPGVRGMFDFAFLDADKTGYPDYLDWCLKLVKPGGLILADNVVRGGAVLKKKPGDVSAEGAAAFNAKLAAEPRLESVILQQVGTKGHDGLAVARVRD